MAAVSWSTSDKNLVALLCMNLAGTPCLQTNLAKHLATVVADLSLTGKTSGHLVR